MENNIVKFKDGTFELDVQVTPEQDTVWLRAEEMDSYLTGIVLLYNVI